MPEEVIRIKRYPNRRFYASHTSRYISLPEIEQLIRDGATVEILDSQTGEDITRSILMQIIAEKHPEKMAMFPTAMLHSILRANQLMTTFLQEYFRNALASLEYFQTQGSPATLPPSMDWMKAWFEHWPISPFAKGAPKNEDAASTDETREMAERISRLEQRIAELEGKATGSN